MAIRIGAVRVRRGVTNNLHALTLSAAASLAILGFLLYRGVQQPGDGNAPRLFMYCAAGLRYPVEEIVQQYRQRYGVQVEIQYGGSNTLLNQLEVARVGDLYLCADETYIRQARSKGLVREVLPIAFQTPVIVVKKGNPKRIAMLDDLLREDVTVALGNPDGAAIGKITHDLLTAAGLWEKISAHVTKRGVFKPTVNEIANDVKLGSVDAGIIWDATAAQYPELESIKADALDPGASLVEVGVLSSARNPSAAIRFARYVAASNAGLETFAKHSLRVTNGDLWDENPEITFFAGSVNRRALEPIISEFERREGVRVNTVYNGCGILTAQMRTIQQNQDKTFPDAYMACDVYYLDNVRELFQEAVNVSDTDIVIAVQKGNPKGIRELKDLTRAGMRVAVGQPEQCTIGALTKRLLEHEGLYDTLISGNVVTQTATSAMLVPAVTTNSADAALAYATDTLGEPGRIEVIRLDSELAKAIQPFSIARSSQHKQVARRLFEQVARSREIFEKSGFHWRLDASGEREVPAEKP